MTPAAGLAVPDHLQDDSLAAELDLRLLSSALVDADYLDTERRRTPVAPEPRTAAPACTTASVPI